MAYRREVRLGEHDLASVKDCEKDDFGEECADDPIDVQIEEQITHDNYSILKKSQKYDIGLLRLVRSIAYTFFIKPICLQTTNIDTLSAIDEGTNMLVAGWGSTETGNQSTKKLFVSIPYFNFANCSSIYQRRFITIDDSQLCAGGVEGFDSCTGDSGGPLMYKPPNQIYWYAIGVVSFGLQPCASDGVPGVYTNVNYFMEWIVSKTKN